MVPRGKILEETVTIRCAHGDTVLYPVAKVQVMVDGKAIEVKAAVSKTLPVDVLLGEDVPEFYELLDRACGQRESRDDAMTRARKLRQRGRRFIVRK